MSDSLSRNNSIQQLTQNRENANEVINSIGPIDSSEHLKLNAEKSSPLLKEKRIAVPIASRIVKEDVIQRIKTKVNSNTQPSNPSQYSFSNSFLSEFMAFKAKEKIPDNHSDVQDEEKRGPEKRPIVKNPMIMGVNNQDVYNDGSELDLSLQTLKQGRTIKNLDKKPKLMSEEDPAKHPIDEIQNDVIKLLYCDTDALSISNRWEQRNEQKYNFSNQIPNIQMSYDISHGRSQLQLNTQGVQNEGVPFKYVSPQTCKIPSSNLISALSTETTFDGDFFANYEPLNTTSTTTGTQMSVVSKKNSENLLTPSKPGTETKLHYKDSDYQIQTINNQKAYGVVHGPNVSAKNNLRTQSVPVKNQSALILGTESSDRSSQNDENIIYSNVSTPQSQGQPLIVFPQTYSQKNIMESFNSASPDYGMNQSYANSQPQNNVLNLLDLFKGLGIQNTGLVNYNPDVSGGLQMKQSGKNSQRIPEEEQNSEIYEIDINRLASNPKTSVMIKNIPNKYSRELMMQDINKSHQGTYNFFYLPIDFKNKCNVGYAFINFIDSKFIKHFYLEFNNKKWERFKSEKICKIKYARLQGIKVLKQHFRSSIVMNQMDANLRPWILDQEEDEIEQELANFQLKNSGQYLWGPTNQKPQRYYSQNQ